MSATEPQVSPPAICDSSPTIPTLDKARPSNQHRRQRTFPMTDPLSPDSPESSPSAAELDAARRAANSAVAREAMLMLALEDRDRTIRMAAFNYELGLRLASLDRGEHIHPVTAHQRLLQKKKRRKRSA